MDFVLLDSLVFTQESEEDDIIGGDNEPDPGLDHSCIVFHFSLIKPKKYKTCTI